MALLLLLPLMLVFGLFDMGSASEDGSAQSDTAVPDDDDTLTLTGNLDTNSTTNGSDEVFGGAGIDAIDGQNGDDRLLGFGNIDYLEGAGGNDVLRGGSGNDVLAGGTGADKLVGGTGDDLVIGNSGDDLLEGNSGDDILIGGQGEDTIDGGAGNDILYSFHAADGGPAADGSRPSDWTAEHILAYDIVASNNQALSPDQIEAVLSARGIGEEDIAQSPPDGQTDVLNGGSGSDVLLLGGGDEGIGGADDDSFVVTTANSGGDAAQILDFEGGRDILAVDYQGANAPFVSVEDANGDALVRVDGALLAIVRGGAGDIDATQVRLVRSF